MKHFSLFRLSFLPLILLSFFSCKKETDQTDLEAYKPERLKELIPLEAGKYITYRVDSLYFNNFGRVPEIHSYQVKHVVDAEIMDNIGRPSFRVYRYIRAADGTGEWSANGSYFITLADDQAEMVEDNFRVITLHLPLKEGFTWKGNKHFPSDAYESLGYAFNNDNSMMNWEFNYSSITDTINFNQQIIDNVITVSQVEEINVPDTILVVNNTASIPDHTKEAWIRGVATADSIRILTQSNIVGRKLTLYNEANVKLMLDTIPTPIGYSRDYEYLSGGWFYGNEEDTVLVNRPAYSSKNLGIEKYVKNIGLVYREFEMWEFQPDSGPNPFYIGFGVKMRMIDHN